jgi:hypothetical protein
VAPLVPGVGHAEWKLLVVLAGLAVVVAAGAIVFVLWPEPPSRITRENFERIRPGMTQAEVEAILGPPGDYRTRLGETECWDAWKPDPADYGPAVAIWQPLVGLTPETSAGFWICDSMEIYIVTTDESGRVHQAQASARRRAGTLENLIWRIKRQWRRWFP